MATVRVAAVSCRVGIRGFTSDGPSVLCRQARSEDCVFPKQNNQSKKPKPGGLCLGSDVAQSGSVLKII